MKTKFKSLSLILVLLLTLSSMFSACNNATPTPDIATSEEITTIVTEEVSTEYNTEAIVTDTTEEDSTTDSSEVDTQREQTSHVHTWDYSPFGEIGHFIGYSCGCPSHEGTEPHRDENNDNVCDDCEYQIGSETETESEIETVTETETTNSAETEYTTEIESETESFVETTAETETETVVEAPTETESATETDTEAKTEADSEASSGFDLKDVPAYSGNGYYVVNGNKPYFTEDEITSEAYEKYGDLDSLGRCTTAMACLGKDLMPTGDRGSISSVKPTGWIQKQYSCIKTQDLYNRSHLIAWSLAGEDANKQNLITGTPYLNQENMTLFEDMVRDYIKETGNHVMYRVTPVFEGDNLVASGVLMEAYSVEDKGDAIEFCVYLYNVQPGVVIDYATGESHEEGKDPSEDPGNDNVIEGVEGVPEGTTFIINLSSKKYHKLDSKYVGNLTKNMQYTTLSEAELIAQGYTLCGNCAKGKC